MTYSPYGIRRTKLRKTGCEGKMDVKERAELVGHALFWYSPTKASDLQLYIEEVEKQIAYWKQRFAEYLKGGKQA